MITTTRSGFTITVHDNGAPPSTDLTTITYIEMSFIGDDGYTYTQRITKNLFLTQTTTDITFTIPYKCCFLIQLITVTFTGTSFSGSVALGTLAILLANSSGIYVLTPGKTNDTLYVYSDIDPTTQNVAIPTPMFKTGFIGV